MGLCLVLANFAVLDALRAERFAKDVVQRHAWLGVGLFLAQGALAVQRLDAVVTLLVALAFRAAVRRKPFAFGVWGGLAAAAKFVPLLALPVIMLADFRAWRSARALVLAATGIVLALAVGLLPIVACSPTALADILHYHAARGLQCEATLGVLLGLARLGMGTAVPTAYSFGSRNFEGPVADAFAAASGPLSVVAVLVVAGVAFRAARASAPADAGRFERMGLATLAALLALWLTGKVFSPQYMTWGIPVLAAIPSKRGERLAWLGVLAMALTQLYLRGYYQEVWGQTPIGLATLAARQAVLVVMAVVTVRGLLAGSVGAHAEVDAAAHRQGEEGGASSHASADREDVTV
jgi:hypothetical protein